MPQEQHPHHDHQSGGQHDQNEHHHQAHPQDHGHGPSAQSGPDHHNEHGAAQSGPDHHNEHGAAQSGPDHHHEHGAAHGGPDHHNEHGAAEHHGHGGPDLHHHGDGVHISEALAASLVDDGVHFATCDDVTVHAEGTALSCSVKDLTDLGVDHVVPDPAAHGNLILTLGLDGGEPTAELFKLLEQHDHALFPAAANVGLLVTQAEAQALSTACGHLQNQVVEQLVDLGIDYVKVIGTDHDIDLPDHPHHS